MYLLYDQFCRLALPDSGSFLKKKAHSSESDADQREYYVYRTATVLPIFFNYSIQQWDA